MARLSTIEGIGETFAEKLKEMGISSTDTLLERGATSRGRKEIAERSGISEKVVLRWINHTDFFRIKGVSGEYAELLEASGVDTIPELAQRNSESLTRRIIETNEEKKLVRKLPSQNQVTGWIEQAKKLPRVITH
jgi:predicted flap endonuclease-1-like 5' DNA nuclease